MKIYKHGLLLAALLLNACSGDDDNSDEIRSLRAEIAALSSEGTATGEDLEALEAELQALQDELASLTPTPTAPELGANATQGSNKLSANAADKVWRFAVFPDTQGRDDDNMKMYVNVDRDGNVLTDVSEWVGVDYNGDGYYDAGTETATDAMKAADEDGISYLVNVSDPFQPFIETDESGNPIIVPPEERKDFGPDWKILPLPLVEAVTDKMIELDVDLILATGDITEYRAESDYVQWMEKVAAPLSEAGISIFPVRGNHEIVNGRNWPAWFTNEQEWERQSVNNVYNNINPYEGYEQDDFDQGYRLYQAYSGSIVQSHIDSGLATGYPGAEDLVYYFTNDNTLFIAIDFYFAQINNSAYNGTWITLRDWLEDVIKTNAPSVDHIVVYGHEPLSTKKRPQTYDVDVYQAYTAERLSLEAHRDAQQEALDQGIAASATEETIAELTAQLESAQSAVDELEEPSVGGYDIGQLGYLLLQDDSEPGLAEDILGLFTKYQVTYISGHDHQYARSLIHDHPEKKDSADGFTQIIGGNASWKAYENSYGINSDYETGLFIKNFYDDASHEDLTNSLGQVYADITNDLGKGISFVVVEVNGRQITTKSYYADHSLTEVDMNLGAYYDYDTNAWCEYSGDFMVPNSTATTQQCTEVAWQVVDENTRTTDATKRVVEPLENYFLSTKTPEDGDYIGSEASIIDGYNLTYDASYAETVGRLEMMRELLTLSWFADEDDTTVSDILLISGNQNQDGSYFFETGDVEPPLIDVDAGELALGLSPSITFVNRSIVEVNNPTHVTRDGIVNKGTDIEASLNPEIENGNPSGNAANWDGRYLNDNLDFADAMTIVFKAPEDADLSTLTLGRFDEATETWVPAFTEACFIESGYSQHFTSHYRISEQHPEGNNNINNCQQRYWGYTKGSHTIWGFVHTDGKFALIPR